METLVATQGARTASAEATLTAIRPAALTEVPELTRVLCRAFDDDPVMNWLVRQDHERGIAFRRHFEMSLRKLTMPYREVYTTDDLCGVALWTPPAVWNQGCDDRKLIRHMSEVAGPDRLQRVLAALAALEEQRPATDHFYLFELAVDPDSQRRGIGSRLLRHVLKRCDEKLIPAYLESTKECNVPLYERHGFQVTKRVQLGGNGPPLWLMWREPSP